MRGFEDDPTLVLTLGLMQMIHNQNEGELLKLKETATPEPQQPAPTDDKQREGAK